MTRVMHRFAIAGVQAAICGCTVTQEQPTLVAHGIGLTYIDTSDIHPRPFPYNFQPSVVVRDHGLTLPPYGGIARMARIAKRIRATAQRSLWLDSGDCFQGAQVFNLF